VQHVDMHTENGALAETPRSQEIPDERQRPLSPSTWGRSEIVNMLTRSRTQTLSPYGERLRGSLPGQHTEGTRHLLPNI
jgi:hypothetical protein